VDEVQIELERIEHRALVRHLRALGIGVEDVVGLDPLRFVGNQANEACEIRFALTLHLKVCVSSYRLQDCSLNLNNSEIPTP